MIVNPREIHRIYLNDDSVYERIVINFSNQFLKDISTAQTNILSAFHKNKAHILHFSEEEMKCFLNNQMQMRNLWNKKEFGAGCIRKCMASNFINSSGTADSLGRGAE